MKPNNTTIECLCHMATRSSQEYAVTVTSLEL